MNKIFNGFVRSIDRKSQTLAAAVSTDSRDRDDEILLPKGARLSRYRKNPVVLWAHDYGGKPIAKALGIGADNNALIAKVQFAPTKEGREVFDLYAGKFLSAWSVGYLPIPGKGHAPTEAELTKRPDWVGAEWIYDEWELLEFSAVPVPNNPDALTLAARKGLHVPKRIKEAQRHRLPRRLTTVAAIERDVFSSLGGLRVVRRVR